jgi:AP endonuclease-1
LLSTMSATIRKTIATTAATAVRSSKTRRTPSPTSNDDLPARPTKRAKIVKEATLEESQESQVTLVNGVAGVTIESQATLVEEPSAPVKAPKGRKKKVAAEPSLADYPPRASRDWKVGAHISAAGGIENAVVNAAKIG